MKQKRYIIHVDMDAFYASIEQRDNPQLISKPVIVAGAPNKRGVVCAASYEARKYGLHSAMPTQKAIKLCPNVIILPVRMSYYAEISRQIHKIFENFTSEIEPISLDEAFLDITGSIKLLGSAEKIAKQIKLQIKEQLNLIASVGIGPNKFLAKLASGLDKPDGFVIISEENKQEILDNLDIAKIWGIGKAAQKKLRAKGIYKINQLRKISINTLNDIFGKQAQEIYNFARGIDNRPVRTHRNPKSISTEQTFAQDISDKDVLLNILLQQVEDVSYRLRKNHLSAKTITIKLRYANFRTFTRSESFSEKTDITQILWERAKNLFIKWHDTSGTKLRLLGFSVSNLQKTDIGQAMLFTDITEQKQKMLDNTVDKIKDKFGANIIKRGI